MDRQAFSTGQLVPNSQLLGAEKGKLVALGYALEAIMGAGGTVVSGLACTPTASPSLSVVVGRGSIMTTAAIDPTTAYSDLGTDTNATIKQGILQEPGVTLTLTPPSTSGYSQVYLIQATQSDSDTSTTIPFYNASNPAVPYNGPNNSGNATLTLRQSKCVVSLKAGAAATTGSQVAPSADTGNVGLYTITLVNGQTTIQANQIVTLASAPFVPVTLPQVPAGVQAGQWLYGVDTGSAGALVVALSPIPTAFPDGMEIHVKAANAASGSDTINVSGLGALPIRRRGGATPVSGDWAAGDILGLRKTGSVWQITGLVPSDVKSFLDSKNIIGNNTVPFLSSTTWTCPANVTRVRARGVGGGGGGGGSQSTSGGAASGGGAGGYFDGVFTVVPGTTYTITIGAGGTAGTSAGAAPGNGSSTSFDSFATAVGGGSGLAANGNTASPGGTGGSATGSGAVNLVGSAGGNGLNIGGIYFGGQGGPAPFLGSGYAALGLVGQQGTRFGGGGGGGSYQNNGAAGSAGYLELTY